MPPTPKVPMNPGPTSSNGCTGSEDTMQFGRTPMLRKFWPRLGSEDAGKSRSGLLLPTRYTDNFLDL